MIKDTTNIYIQCHQNIYTMPKRYKIPPKKKYIYTMPKKEKKRKKIWSANIYNNYKN